MGLVFNLSHESPYLISPSTRLPRSFKSAVGSAIRRHRRFPATFLTLAHKLLKETSSKKACEEEIKIRQACI